MLRVGAHLDIIRREEFDNTCDIICDDPANMV